MQLENIILTKQKHLATITINHPPVNAFKAVEWQEMADDDTGVLDHAE